MKSVQDVMRSALALARHQLGMHRAQAFCDHKWEYLKADRITSAPVERECRKCHLRQEAVTVWRDIKEQAHDFQR